jgi:outer membrane protein assembly factor BamB
MKKFAYMLVLLAMTLSAAPGDFTMPLSGWPCWRGPTGDNRAIPAEGALVTSYDDVTLVWESGDTIPDGLNCSMTAGTRCLEVSGGYASPIVYDNKVYLFYYVPSGDVYDSAFSAETGESARWLIEADDVVHCFDASNGETLWKKVFARKGLNFSGSGKTGPQLTPCTAGDRIFAMGTMGRVYCLDAQRGDSLWENNIGGRFDMMQMVKDSALANKAMPVFNRDFMSCPMVIGGAVVCNTHLLAKGDFYDYEDGYAGLIAFDAESGEKLWHKDTCAGYLSTPTRWVADDGNEFIITANDGYHPYQKMWCIEPLTGRVLWEMPSFGNGDGIVVSGNYMICNTNETGASKVGLYLIDTIGATLQWTFQPPILLGATQPFFMGDHVYVRLSGGQFACLNIDNGAPAGELHMLEGGMGFISGGNDIILTDDDHSHRGGLINIFSRGPEFKKLDSYWGITAAHGYMHPIVPALVKGLLYIRMPNRLHCYDFRESAGANAPPGRRRTTSMAGRGKHSSDQQIFATDIKGRTYKIKSRSAPFSGVAILSTGNGASLRIIGARIYQK